MRMQTMAGRHRGGRAGGGVAGGVDLTGGEVGSARGSPTPQNRKRDPRWMTIRTGSDRLSSDTERTMAGTTAEQILITTDETPTMIDLIPTPGDTTLDPMITAEIIMMRIDPHLQSRIDLSRNQRSLIMLTSHQRISYLESQKPHMWPHRLSLTMAMDGQQRKKKDHLQLQTETETGSEIRGPTGVRAMTGVSTSRGSRW